MLLHGHVACAGMPPFQFGSAGCRLCETTTLPCTSIPAPHLKYSTRSCRNWSRMLSANSPARGQARRRYRAGKVGGAASSQHATCVRRLLQARPLLQCALPQTPLATAPPTLVELAVLLKHLAPLHPIALLVLIHSLVKVQGAT